MRSELLKHVAIAEARRLKKSFRRARNEVLLSYHHSKLTMWLGFLICTPACALIFFALAVLGVLGTVLRMIFAVPDIAFKTIFKYAKAVLKKRRLKNRREVLRATNKEKK